MPPPSPEESAEPRPEEAINPQQRQYEELQTVGSNLLHRKVAEAVDKKHKKEDPSAGQNILAGIREFWGPKNNDYKPISFVTDKSPQGKAIEGNPIFITLKDGKRIEVTHLASADKNSFFITIPGMEKGDWSTISISRQDMANAQLVSEKEKILAEFSEDERPIIERYLDTVDRGPAALPTPGTPEAEALNKTIKEAAKSAGILTSEHMTSIVEVWKKNKLAQGQTEEQIAPQIAKAMEKLNGVNVMDAKSTMAVLEELGMNPGPETINQEISDLNKKFADIQTSMTVEPSNGPTLQPRANQIQERLALLTQISDQLSGDGSPLQAYFAAAEKGTINPEQAKSMIDAIESGDILKIIKAARPELFEPKPGETPAETQARLAEIDKLTKSDAAFGLLLLLFFAGATAVKAGASTLGSSPRQ